MYNELSDKEKKKIIKKKYLGELMSFAEIAELMQTYPNRVRRDAKKFGIRIRSRSESAKIALDRGRSKHPTKGKKRDSETKKKISESQGKVWDSLSAEERQKRSNIGKESWNKKTEQEKSDLIQKGSAAIRESARTGTKLERFLLEELTKRKYDVQFHREHVLKNSRLEIDLFVKQLRTAIEIDGPSHFRPVWGEKNLLRNKKSDKQKTGLILSQGFVLIRVKQDKRTSQRYFREVLNSILNILSGIKKQFPIEGKRYIEV
tara:strand:+ start:9583 stop:10365 length:783 start_codon:yes stop_codon:yes gene_type:complete